jgi:hypothetical protein
MWTDEHRAKYRRDETEFPSNLTDTEWERLAPLIPAAKSLSGISCEGLLLSLTLRRSGRRT